MRCCTLGTMDAVVTWTRCFGFSRNALNQEQPEQIVFLQTAWLQDFYEESPEVAAMSHPEVRRAALLCRCAAGACTLLSWLGMCAAVSATACIAHTSRLYVFPSLITIFPIHTPPGRRVPPPAGRAGQRL